MKGFLQVTDENINIVFINPNTIELIEKREKKTYIYFQQHGILVEEDIKKVTDRIRQINQITNSNL